MTGPDRTTRTVGRIGHYSLTTDSEREIGPGREEHGSLKILSSRERVLLLALSVFLDLLQNPCPDNRVRKVKLLPSGSGTFPIHRHSTCVAEQVSPERKSRPSETELY